MIWWEKTVEYKFILGCPKEVRDFLIAPLDGKHEGAGDTIFASDNKWILIEFKKDKDSVNDEKKKFADYTQAEKELENRDYHHVLIYGTASGKDLVLSCETYFSKIPYTSAEMLLKQGTEKDKFFKYIDDFMKHKKNTFDNQSSGSSSFANVVAVNKDNEVVCTATLQEIQQEYNKYMDLDKGQDRGQELKFEIKRPGSSLGFW